MFKRSWRRFVRLLAVGGVTGVLLVGGQARADDKDTEALRQRLERLEKQNEELQNALKKILDKTQETAAEDGKPAKAAEPDKKSVEKIVGDVLKERDEKKKKEDEAKKAKEEEEGHKVGSDLKLSARWNLANGVTFETPNKDFVSHLGVRFQYDSVWFDQSNNLRPASQVGNLQDGTFFRRIRPSWDGTAWEVMEWNVELALEQVQQSLINLDEVWVGITKLPVIGTVRIGHMKVPQGFEGDMVSSSRAMTFLERAAYTDAFYQNFASGVWLGNNFLDQHVTYAAMAYRQDNALRGNNGADFGDGDYGVSGRLTALPIYENEGRELLHLGVSGSWRKAEKPDAAAGSGLQGGINPGQIRFRARPELRDAIGDFGTSPLPGNSVRWVDTGALRADSATVLGTEFFAVLGPLSFQAEYAWAWANNTVVGGRNRGDLGFDGGYVQVSYFLTGENRIYDRRLGRLGSTYIATPYTPFFATSGEGGGFLFGRGAWEVAARYSHLNLDSGVVQGGIMDGIEVGLNWYLNTNLKIQFEYLHNNRFHLRPGQVPGDLDGLGIRTQFFF